MQAPPINKIFHNNEMLFLVPDTLLFDFHDIDIIEFIRNDWLCTLQLKEMFLNENIVGHKACVKKYKCVHHRSESDYYPIVITQATNQQTQPTNRHS